MSGRGNAQVKNLSETKEVVLLKFVLIIAGTVGIIYDLFYNPNGTFTRMAMDIEVIRAGLDPSAILIGSIFVKGVGWLWVFADGTTKKVLPGRK